MARYDSFRKRFFQIRDWIALMQRSEWGRDFQRAFGDLVDRVAARAIGSGDVESALRAWRGGERASATEGKDQARD